MSRCIPLKTGGIQSLLDGDRLARVQPRPSSIAPSLVETLDAPDQSGSAGTQEAEESQEVSEALEEDTWCFWDFVCVCFCYCVCVCVFSKGFFEFVISELFHPLKFFRDFRLLGDFGGRCYDVLPSGWSVIFGGNHGDNFRGNVWWINWQKLAETSGNPWKSPQISVWKSLIHQGKRLYQSRSRSCGRRWLLPKQHLKRAEAGGAILERGDKPAHFNAGLIHLRVMI